MEGAKHWIADTVETVSEALGGISSEPMGLAVGTQEGSLEEASAEMF